MLEIPQISSSNELILDLNTKELSFLKDYDMPVDSLLLKNVLRTGNIVYGQVDLPNSGLNPTFEVQISISDECIEKLIFSRSFTPNLPTAFSTIISDLRENYIAKLSDSELNPVLHKMISGQFLKSNELYLEEFEDNLSILVHAPEGQVISVSAVEHIWGKSSELGDSWVPGDFKNSTGIERLKFRISQVSGTPTIQFAEVRFKSSKVWSIVPGHKWLDIGNLWCDLSIDYPTDPDRYTSFNFGGSLYFGEDKSEIAIQARWPDLEISGALIKDQSILLDTLLENTGLPKFARDTGQPGLAIDKLSFSADPSTDRKKFEFEFDLKTGLEWVHQSKSIFSLKNIGGRLKYVGAHALVKEELTGEIHSEMEIAGLSLLSRAEKDENGWTFYAFSQGGIKLHEFVEHFFDHSSGLPTDLELSELYGKFNFTTKDLEFRVALKDSPGSAHWNITKDIQLSFKDFEFSVERINKKLIGTLILDFELNQLNFQASATYSDGWDFKAVLTTVSGDIGTFIRSFDSKIKLPASLDSLIIQSAELEFNSHTGDRHFEFECNSSSLFGPGSKGDFILKISIEGKTNELTIEGHLTLQVSGKELLFDLIFDKAPSGSTFVAAYHDETGETISFKNLVNAIMVGKTPPLGNDIGIKDAYIVNSSSGGTNKYILHGNVDLAINLAQLPLIGKVLPDIGSVALEMKLLYASDKFVQSTGEITAINKLLQKHDPLPDIKGNDLDKISVDTNLTFSGKKYALSDGPNPSDLSPPPAALTLASPPRATSDPSADKPELKWIGIHKKIPPIQFNRIGVGYENNKFYLFPDASLDAGGLSLSLDGLGVATSLSPFQMEYFLSGLSLNLQKGPLEIGGAFLREIIGGIDEYNGLAVIKSKALSISAIGSYARDAKGNNSLFIFAFLEQALGGPSFFFVEGLALAFGYNRRFVLPSDMSKAGEFPLVKVGMGGLSGSSEMDILHGLSTAVPMEVGQMFFGVGVKFNSFKLIDSFALLVFQLGNVFEIDLIGQSQIIVPFGVPKQEALAYMKVNLTAKFAPEEGLLAVRAQITNDSYIISPNCSLSGGAAFYSWFKGDHSGDFVFTMGGYHPNFSVPEHYPHVPRLALNWQVDEHLSVKGDMYFALCPHALMAGGHLEADYLHGKLHAWFRAGADFLIQWQPYHYEGSLYLDIGVKYRFISLDLGVHLELWGPEFGGHAEIDVYITTVSVDFGSSQPSTQPLNAPSFENNCLPGGAWVGMTIAQGQHGTDATLIPIVNPKEVQILIEGSVPLENVSQIVPMASGSGWQVSSTSGNPIIVKDASGALATNFVITTKKKSFPTALWDGGPLRLKEFISGFEVTTDPPPLPLGLKKSNSPVFEDFSIVAIKTKDPIALAVKSVVGESVSNAVNTLFN